MTEFNLVDGQALTQSDFGEYNPITGVWQPKAYTGTYGTNGFYLPMKETTQATGFNTVTFTGTNATQSISNVGFSPDLVWFKNRSGANNHALYDTVRGRALSLISNATNSDITSSAGNDLASFDSNGFTVGPIQNHTSTNGSGQNIVAWCWDAGSSTVSNTDGTITSTVRANPASGFSIVTYTNASSGSQTVGHGLGTAPDVVIVKVRSTTSNWFVYHSELGATKNLYLDATNAENTQSNIWNDTAPTSSVFNIGTAWNGSATSVAYCFSEVAGFSKFGSYTGTGASGNSVTGLGFEPAFVMIKRTDSTGDWQVYDNTRDIDDPRLLTLYANGSFAEDQNATNRSVDFDSDGFTIDSTGVYLNASGGTFIYMAFADTRDYQWNFDASGNKNNWTPNNINSNASSETTYDLMSDTPSLADEDTSNFATLNPLYAGINGLSASNLTFTPSGWMHIPSTISLPTDSSTGIYWEETLTTAVAANYHASGVTNGKHTASTAFDSNNAVISMSGGAWRLYKSGDANNAVAITGAGGSASNGDVHMFAYKNGYLYWGINGSWYPTGANPATDTSPLNASQITAQQYALCGGYTGITKSINFGQRPFKYTPPTGYKKLNTFNLPDSSITDGSQYMNTVLWTGTGSQQNITGLGFSPDLVWVKERSAADNHQLADTVRGANKILYSDLTNAEDLGSTQKIQSFDSDGFTIGTSAAVNQSSQTYVGWSWRASDSTAVSNTDGTITSTVSANTTSGFSVVTYTGNGTAGSTVGHGLGSTPKFIITKARTGTNDWGVYHTSIGNTAAVFLSGNYAVNTNIVFWNNTSPTSSVFTIGTNNVCNTNTVPYVAYCFAEVEGFSKFGSYTGNGSTDGPFVYTGFRPAFIVYKRTDTTGNWRMQDTARDTNNDGNSDELFPNLSNAEASSARFDILSNGFKARTTSADTNASGGTYIYMAFAENPFKNSLAR